MASTEGEPRPNREGVLFFGAVAAGLSHEISNILNIINELAGLQHDISQAAAEGGDARVSRIADLADRIKAQVTRGEEVNRRLHGFAHSIDSTETTIDLAELLALLAFLEARPARLAGVDLAVQLPERTISLHGDPFALLLAIHGSVKTAIIAAGSGGKVEVTVRPGDGGARIRVGCSAVMPTEGAAAAPLRALHCGAGIWRAAIETEPVPDAPQAIILNVPAAAPEARRSPADQPSEEVP